MVNQSCSSVWICFVTKRRCAWLDLFVVICEMISMHLCPRRLLCFSRRLRRQPWRIRNAYSQAWFYYFESASKRPRADGWHWCQGGHYYIYCAIAYYLSLFACRRLLNVIIIAVWQFVTGEVPFQGLHHGEVIHRVVTQDLRPGPWPLLSESSPHNHVQATAAASQAGDGGMGHRSAAVTQMAPSQSVWLHPNYIPLATSCWSRHAADRPSMPEASASVI
jgi:hypothetical protein